ncbi:MAG: hypothetical protein WA913_16990, partial [Pricia sp.]
LIVGNNDGEVYTVSVNGNLNKPDKHIAHTSAVNDIALSPDGKRIATVGDDNTIVIWDSKNWDAFPIKANTILKSDLGFPYSVAFTPDNNHVLVAYEYGVILKWPTSLDVLSNLICEDVDIDLTTKELKTLLINEDANKE